jgi:hypothetical protein
VPEIMHAPGAAARSLGQAGFAGQLVEGGVDTVVGEPSATQGDEKACRGRPRAELISPGAVGPERFQRPTMYQDRAVSALVVTGLVLWWSTGPLPNLERLTMTDLSCVAVPALAPTGQVVGEQ